MTSDQPNPSGSICEGCLSLDLGTVFWEGRQGYIDTSDHHGLDSMIDLKHSSAHCSCCEFICEALDDQIQIHSRRRLLGSNWREWLEQERIRAVAIREEVRVGVLFALSDLPVNRDDFFATLSFLTCK